MSEIISWIAAVAEDPQNLAGEILNPAEDAESERKVEREEKTASLPLDLARPNFSLQDLPVHQFPAVRQQAIIDSDAADARQTDACATSETVPTVGDAMEWEDPLDRDPDLWLYRKRTIGILRRYLRYSLETGRLPSILGSEFFRTQVTSYRVSTFEDRVVFVHDVEVCLEKLDGFARKVIGQVILQEHSQGAAARRLGCARKTVTRRLFTALDELSEQFLHVGMLARVQRPRELVREEDDEL